MAIPGTRSLVESHITRVQALGALMVAGGAIGWLTAVLPPSPHGSEIALATYGTVGIMLGSLLLIIRDEVPEAVLGAAVAVGTVLITLASREGGAQAATQDNAMLYVWVCLYAFYYFRLPHALLQLCLAGVAYALLLEGSAPADGLATRWGITLGSLLLAGLVIARLRKRINALITELSNRAREDDLTGALNRRGLEERTAVELARARREGTETSMIVLDIDRFKEFNDRCGHHVGDEILRRVAAALGRSTRAIDATARIGGDEFAVVLPGATSEMAQAIADRLRAEIGESRVGGDGSPISISVGIATASDPGSTLDELWHAADLAMYEGKRAGGDNIRAAEETAAPLHSGRD